MNYEERDPYGMYKASSTVRRVRTPATVPART